MLGDGERPVADLHLSVDRASRADAAQSLVQIPVERAASETDLPGGVLKLLQNDTEVVARLLRLVLASAPGTGNAWFVSAASGPQRSRRSESQGRNSGSSRASTLSS